MLYTYKCGISSYIKYHWVIWFLVVPNWDADPIKIGSRIHAESKFTPSILQVPRTIGDPLRWGLHTMCGPRS
jgi:hypothetical protein